MSRIVCWLAAPAFLVGLVPGLEAQIPRVDLRKGDRVVFMGDTFAEREAMFGYLETMLHAQFPEHKLTFRNLAYSADTPAVLLADLKGTMEYNHGSNRALNFRTMPEHLADAKADVIFLCLGMAASLEGRQKADDFARDLEALLKAYGEKQFNGKAPPRFVLVGPIAHENLGGAYPDPGEHNERLALINDAMKRVAQTNKIPFVELFRPMANLMEKNTGDRFTFNGIHLTQYGYWAAAQIFIEQLGFQVPRFQIEYRGPLDNQIQYDPGKDRACPPPPPLGSMVHPVILGKQNSLKWAEVNVPRVVLEIDGKPFASFTRDELRKTGYYMASPDHASSEKLRHAIVARNTEFFYKFRAVNGEYAYGRRFKPFGVVNFPGEMKKLDDLCGELDQQIHSLIKRPALFQARLRQATDKEVLAKVHPPDPARPSTEKTYNQTQGIIGGKEVLTAKDPEEARKLFKLPEGYEINLFASEKDFPLHNPLAMAFDAKGRLWVTTLPSYPHYLPGSQPNDKILILEDTKGVGKADKCTVFADGLYLPTGIEFGEGGVYVGAQPNIMFLKDTNGDDVADSRETILHGFGSGDSHHAVHAFVRTPEGHLLIHEGIFHRTNVETPHGVMRQHDAAIWRFQPKSHKLDLYVSYNFANPWGHVFDKWGFNFIADASGGANYNALPITGHVDFPRQHPGMKVFTQPIIRPTCGCELVSSRHFPDEAQGNFLFNNNITFQGIKQFQVIEEKSGFTAKELEPLLVSKDPNFRPVALKFGPDGALYVVDWYNPLIGHMQHSIRDPGRDHFHGRIWRITAKGRPLVRAPKIAGAKLSVLFDLLESPEDATRYRVRAELRERKGAEVIAAMEKWFMTLGEVADQNEHLLLEALWVQASHDAINPELHTRLLRAKDFRVRGAATRLLRERKTYPNLSAARIEYLNQLFDQFAEGRGFFLISEGSMMRGTLTDFAKANGIQDGKIHRQAFLEFHAYLQARRSGDTQSTSAMGQLQDQVNDVHPRVRLEAVVALSFFKTPRAAEIALEALKHPMDYYLDYGLKETMTTLEPYWKPMLAAGKPFATNNPAGANYLLANVKNEELVKLPRNSLVYLALLTRDNIQPADRLEALEGLAKINKTDLIIETFAALERLDQAHDDHGPHVLHELGMILARRPASDLAKSRKQLESLAKSGKKSLTRQLALSALVTADGGFDQVWPAKGALLLDLVEAVPLIPEGGQRTSAFEKVAPLLSDPSPALRRAAMNALVSMPGKESEAFARLAGLIQEGQDREPALRAVRKIPRNRWPVDQLPKLSASLVQYLKQLPARDRTEIAALEAWQLANDLAAFLPADQAKVIRGQLGDLGVNIVMVRTIPHLMLFDRPKFHVEAGKPVVLVFENTDIMPHNLLLATPGSLAELGLAAEKLANDPAFAAKQFVPPGKKVLHATKMLQPGQVDRLQFIAPTTPGDYVYVCTFPGHWRVMNGVMKVVAKLADVPPEELNPPTTIVKEVRPFVRNWTVEELTPDLINLDKPRSFARGKELFKASSCIQCHKMNREGGDLGPDLFETSKKLANLKMSKIDLLREVLDPSKVIEEKYRPRTFITTNNQVFSGLVVYRDKKIVRIANNPQEKPKEIAVADIEEETPSKISIMPNGLLVTLQREEIYDLLAYIVAGGDENHPLYRRKE